MSTRDYIAIAAQYQADVIAGTIPACKWVQLACARNRRDLDHQETAAFPYRFDPDVARRICQFAELLPHIKGPKAFVTGRDDHDRPTWNAITLEPWQCWIFTVLFGWLRADGLRRFRVSLILVPRKNGKSVMGAIIALYLFAVEGGSGAECYSAATTRDQAKIVAEIAWEMASRSPQFREQFGVKLGSRTTRSLSIPSTAAKFAPLSADAQSLDGLNILCAIIDELHAHKTRAVWDVLDTATGAQPQPLLAAITTAGVELGGICHEKLGYLEKILDGVAEDEAFFGTNYTIDAQDDYRLESSHRKANPNWGVSLHADDLMRKVGEAQHSPAAINNFLTKHCNVWVRTEAGWMTGTQWQTCKVGGLRIEDFADYPCWIGVDLAEVRDIAALIALFKLAPDRYAMFGRFYLPAAAVQRSPIAQMSGWVRDEVIIQTTGDQADYRRIQADILLWVNKFKVQEVDFDRALAAHMQQELKAAFEPTMGRDAVDKFVVTVPQTVETMDPAMKMVERLVLAKGLQHDGNPAQAWMIANVVVERNYKDEIYPRKAGGKDSPNKIDGPVALFTCLSQAMQAQVRDPEYRMFIVGGPA